MATFRMIQPGLASVTRDDGASMVLPLTEQDAAMQGLTPEAQAPDIPQPDMRNPYSMASSPEAVAGPGGGPLDALKIHVQQGGLKPFEGSGGGVAFGAAPSDKFAAFRTHLGTPEADAAASAAKLATGQSAAKEVADVDAMSPAKREAYFARKEGTPSAVDTAKNLVQVGSGERSSTVPSQQQGMSPEAQAVFEESLRANRGGGGGPAGLRVTGETRKFQQAGQVDPALSADITQKQAEQDQNASNQLEDEALHKGDYLEQQASLQQQNAQRIQAEMTHRQAVDAEIGRLNAKSQAAQDELAAAKPKQVDQFWKDKGLAVRLSSAVAILFGGQLALRTGGQNEGLKAVNMNIDRWMNDQVQSYNAAKDKATLTNNAYKDALATYGSPELARTNLQLQALAAKDALIKNTADQIGTTDALGKAQLALQDSQLQREKLKAQAQALAGAEVEQKLSFVQAGGGGGNKHALRDAYHDAAGTQKDINEVTGRSAGPNDVKDARERQIRLSNGDIVWTNSAPKATELQKSLSAGANAVSLMEQISQKVGNGAVIDLNTRKEIEALQDRALTAISGQEFQGVVTKADAERAEKTLADKNAIFSDGGAGLRATLSAVKGGIAQTVRDNTYRDPNATKPYAAPGASTFTPGL